jgi:hypothetical protein
MITQLAFTYHQPPPARRRICDLPAEERPLYRLHRHGTDALASTELLSLVLGTAEAPGIAAEILSKYGSLHQLARANPVPARLSLSSARHEMPFCMCSKKKVIPKANYPS